MGVVSAIYGFAVGELGILYIPTTLFNRGHFIVFWGAAIVLFLLKWINVHNDDTQKFWIEISSQVVNGMPILYLSTTTSVDCYVLGQPCLL